MNQIIGLSIGGVFVALLGVTLPIEYDAITFFAAALLLLWIPRAKKPATRRLLVLSRGFGRSLRKDSRSSAGTGSCSS